MKILCTRPWEDWEKEAIAEVVGSPVFLEPGKQGSLEELVGEAEILFGFPHVPVDTLVKSKTLKLIHVQSTGVDRFVTPALRRSQIILTNSRGVHAKPVAEHAVALMIALAYNIRGHFRTQSLHAWEDPGIDRLEGKVAGLLGLGAIGEEIARKCKSFDMKVIGVRRNSSQTAPQDVDVVYPASELVEVLRLSDYVLCSLPLTDETRSSLRYEHFAAMKPTACFINVGRGPVADEEGLIRALKYGKIRGAGLDVFETEPLPKDSPLWDMENVVITPHTAGKSDMNRNRTIAILKENLLRLREKRPLINVIDKQAGY
jgi:phosphoglycerate dehydrogenase-like enzyme